MFRVTSLLLLALMVTVQAQDPLQKMNLEPSTTGRFTITDRVWPENHGDGDVCIWKDDKLTAVSITVDDDPLFERDWWLSMAAKYGFQMSWMLVTDGLYTDGGWDGAWADWQVAFDAGMECQSHTSTHNCSPEDLDADGIYHEYFDSRQGLDTNIIGNRALAMAGPCGNIVRDEAKKYWIANRGVTGTLQPVNKIDYMNTGKIDLSLAALKSAMKNRSWYTILYHNVASTNLTPEEKADAYANTEAKLAYLKQYEADVWGVGFARAAQYGQSRDTHTLTVNEVTADLIRFTLTDSMADSLFDRPLTVKFRLDDAWSALVALQGGDTLDCGMMFHEGNKYVLVDAVPDGGEVRLERYEPTAVVSPVIVTATGRYLDTVTVTLQTMVNGASLYYTLDGSDPDESSTLYGGPFVLTDDALIKVKGYKTGLTASTVESLQVVIEREAPEVDKVTAVADPTLVYINFSEVVDSALAATPGTYAIDNGITVTAAEVMSDGSLIKLTVSDLSADVDYTLSITGLRDISNNVIAAGTEVAFTFEPPPSDPGLTGLWRFDETDGAAMALDGTGTGNNAILYNAGFMPGQRNNAVVLEGTEESYIDLGRSAFGMYDTYRFSLAFWLKVDYDKSGSIIKRGTYTWPFTVSFSNSSKKISTGIRGSSASFWMSYTFPDTMEFGKWYHVAISHGDSNISYYWNGTQAASFDTVHTIYRNTANSIVGLGLYGMLDEFRIYNEAISASDVAALFADTTVEQTTGTDSPIPDYGLRIEQHNQSGNVIRYYRINGEEIPSYMMREQGVYLEFDGTEVRKVMIIR